MKSVENPLSVKEYPATRMLSAGMLSVRIIQGFIYWGGGSRRFIYAPQKLNPDAGSWMANKFQTAMPGALLGLDHIISYMLQHFWLLYSGVIIFSLAELIAGLFLITGLLTRLSAFLTILFSIVLMLLFGWQGATCIDEWTMAACNLAMGATLFFCGSSVYALDNVIYRLKPQLASRKWFTWLTGTYSLPLTNRGLKIFSLFLTAMVIFFNVATYDHYRGSVYSTYHTGPVSPTIHHLTLTEGVFHPDSSVSVHAYLDAGTPESPIHIVDAWLMDSNETILYHWNSEVLASLPQSSYSNDYRYNKFKPGAYGIEAEMGAAATITLPPVHGVLSEKKVILKLRDVSGHSFVISLQNTE